MQGDVRPGKERLFLRCRRELLNLTSGPRKMPPNKRIQKKTLKLECEWGPCQESFSRMENFCKHVETHLNALNTADDDDDDEEAEGKTRLLVTCCRE